MLLYAQIWLSVVVCEWKIWYLKFVGTPATAVAASACRLRFVSARAFTTLSALRIFTSAAALPVAVDVGEERVRRRDDALVDFLTRDERVAVVPLVGEQAAEEEQAFGAGAAAARRGREAADRADAHRGRAGGRLDVGRVDDV